MQFCLGISGKTVARYLDLMVDLLLVRRLPPHHALIRAAPERTRASFYRTAAGAEIDLILELPGSKVWAVEIKRGLAPPVSRGFRIAVEDVGPDRAFLVHGGEDRYPKGGGVEAIGLRRMAMELMKLRRVDPS